MMHGAHIGGQRAGVFLEPVGGLDPRRVLLVGVDVAKATWFVVASNLIGEVMVDGVRLVADRAGLAELERLIATTSSGLDAAVVVVGVRRPGIIIRRWSVTWVIETGWWCGCSTRPRSPRCASSR
jgi:hypothetical protein